MIGITVCVEYDDILRHTLPRNRGHFSEYIIVTSPSDLKTQDLARNLGCELVITNVFYADGASFNKGAAMEEGLKLIRSRESWVTILDADIVLPEKIPFGLCRDTLYGPLRYMVSSKDIGSWLLHGDSGLLAAGPDGDSGEFAGYCQIFHSSSSCLVGRESWYPSRWSHCGGCDSDFQALFTHRSRCSWRVVHLGEDCINWCGRVSERLDGARIRDADDRLRARESLFSDRQGRDFI